MPATTQSSKTIREFNKVVFKIIVSQVFLFTCTIVSAIIFYAERVEPNEITVKMLKVIKNAVRFRFTIQFSIHNVDGIEDGRG